MATIITKRGNGVPTAADLAEGEQAIDLLTGRVYTKSGGVVIECGQDPHVIDFITDVDTTSTAPVDGDVLTWDGVNNLWIPAAASGGSAAIDKPYIIDPTNSQTDVPLAGPFESTTFGSNVGSVHLNSDWEIYSDSTLSTLAYSATGVTGTERTILTTATGLVGNTTYYIRVRYNDNLGNSSEYSNVVSFTTLATGTIALDGTFQGLHNETRAFADYFPAYDYYWGHTGSILQNSYRRTQTMLIAVRDGSIWGENHPQLASGMTERGITTVVNRNTSKGVNVVTPGNTSFKTNDGGVTFTSAGASIDHAETATGGGNTTIVGSSTTQLGRLVDGGNFVASTTAARAFRNISHRFGTNTWTAQATSFASINTGTGARQIINYRSTDNGVSWTKLYDDSTVVNFTMLVDGSCFMPDDNSVIGLVRYTQNNGATLADRGLLSFGRLNLTNQSFTEIVAVGDPVTGIGIPTPDPVWLANNPSINLDTWGGAPFQQRCYITDDGQRIIICGWGGTNSAQYLPTGNGGHHMGNDFRGKSVINTVVYSDDGGSTWRAIERDIYAANGNRWIKVIATNGSYFTAWCHKTSTKSTIGFGPVEDGVKIKIV